MYADGRFDQKPALVKKRFQDLLTFGWTFNIEIRNRTDSAAEASAQKSRLCQRSKTASHVAIANFFLSVLSSYLSTYLCGLFSVTRWLEFFQYLAIRINKNLPNGIQNLSKLVQDIPR